MKFFNIILFTLVLIVSSCSSVVNSNDMSEVYKNCTKIDIVVNSSNSKNVIFFSKLKDSLESKFNLLFSSYKGESNKLCKLIIDNINFNYYSSIIDTSGTTGRNNTKINTHYSIITSNNKTIKNNIIVFYDSNVSENYYSEYVATNKRQDNNINKISEQLFFSVINDLRKKQ